MRRLAAALPPPIEENQHAKDGRDPTSHDEANGNCTPSRMALDLNLAEDGQPENERAKSETSDEVLDEVEQMSPLDASPGALPRISSTLAGRRGGGAGRSGRRVFSSAASTRPDTGTYPF